MLDFYGKRQQTVSDHLKQVMKYLGWRTASPGTEELKELEQFLLDRAMEHDSPSLLFHLAAEYLIGARVIRPGVVTLMEMVGTARNAASALISERVDHLLGGQMRGDLDRLLDDDPETGMTRLAWLARPAIEATALSVKTGIEKLKYLRRMDAHELDLSMPPRERRRFLATVGRRSTVQALMRREERRYPILLALVAQSAVDQMDDGHRSVRPGGVGARVAGQGQDRRGAGRAGEEALLVELDGRTGFLKAFTHGGGRKTKQSAELKRNILAVLIAGGTNLGLARMSEACGVPYDVLAWTQEWYVREETLRGANNLIVNHHYTLGLAKKFGGGTLSSSDGQRFPVRGKSNTARETNIHGGKVLSTITHVSDQRSTYGRR
ncbi:protein of unknown function [Actinomadura madurae]|uniref:Tn3 transposase DDE domain-containing protein n=1 Tax=Actinomadura madurae TaxID=1993 RepID=A0A1I5XHK2_9ACTN|nr:protein of unknown function [Actinomadura madurae]